MKRLIILKDSSLRSREEKDRIMNTLSNIEDTEIILLSRGVEMLVYADDNKTVCFSDSESDNNDGV